MQTRSRSGPAAGSAAGSATRARASSTVWSILRVLMALTIIAAVVTQLAVSLTRTAETGGDVATVAANFFSFFTILSNVIAAAALAWAGAAAIIRPRAVQDSRVMSVVLACATTYMIITGVVYNALLRGITLPQGAEPVPWSNEVLHLIAPIFLLLDVLVGAPARRWLSWRTVWVVIVFPLAWTAYTLIRGPLVTNPTSGQPFWYPYPFLDHHNPGGWTMVAGYVAAIAAAFVVVGFFVVWITRRRARR